MDGHRETKITLLTVYVAEQQDYYRTETRVQQGAGQTGTQ